MRASVLTHKRSKSLRGSLSLPEAILWMALRRKSLGLRFRRQHAFGPYILDFYCPAIRTAVEVDGSCHSTPEAMRHDERRDAWLASRGVRVLRYPAAAILDDESLEGVLKQIAEAAVAPSTAFGGPPPPLRG